MSLSKYPKALDDASSIPQAVDLVTPVDAIAVNRLRDAILAIESELGTSPSGTFGNVRARLNNIKGALTQAEQGIASLEAELGTNPSGTFDTVKARLDNLAAQIPNLQSQIDSIEAIINEDAQVVNPIISGLQVTDSEVFTAVGATAVDPNTLGYPNSTFVLEVILQTTNSSYASHFELFNITEGTVVSHPAVSTTATNATLISVTLSVGGADLPADQTNLLEGRIKLGSGAPPSERAICKYAAIRAIP